MADNDDSLQDFKSDPSQLIEGETHALAEFDRDFHPDGSRNDQVNEVSFRFWCRILKCFPGRRKCCRYKTNVASCSLASLLCLAFGTCAISPRLESIVINVPPKTK